MNLVKPLVFLAVFSLLLAACAGPVETSQPAQASATPSPVILPSHTALPSATLSPQPSNTPSPTSTVTAIATATATHTVTSSPTPTATETPTATPIPTYTTLRGQVTIAQAVCHYGPGAPYLYKYGVYQGSNLEVLARVEGGNYIQIQAIGGNNPCWVRQDYLTLKGDLFSLRPVPADEVKLPPSPYYGPLTGVSAVRNGSEVTVSWHPLLLKAGDDSEQTPYIVEAWVCQGGQIVFTPVGSYQTSARVIDEPGCDQPSRGRVIAAEKHGYTRPVDIAWPQP